MQTPFQKMLGHFLPSDTNAYRPHLLRKPWLLFFLSVILTAEGIYGASLMSGQAAKNYLSAVLPGEVVVLTNTERAQAGDQPLHENAFLTLAAQNKAKDMAAKGYFSHVGPGGKPPWDWIIESGYSYQYAGENLAVRFDSSSDVVNAWMASPTHRANIVKPVYTEIGIGVADGMYEGAPATFVVQYFGTPQKLASGTVAAAKPSETQKAAPPTRTGSSEVAGAETQSASNASSTEPAAAAPVAIPPISARPDVPSKQAAEFFIKAHEASDSTIGWILAGLAALLVLLVALAIFVHIEIQPGDMLAGGAFVGVIAISFFMLNASTGAKAPAQQAAVADAFSITLPSVLVDDAAASAQGDSAVAAQGGR